jgi:hypothetical protein
LLFIMVRKTPDGKVSERAGKTGQGTGGLHPEGMLPAAAWRAGFCRAKAWLGSSFAGWVCADTILMIPLFLGLASVF